MFGLGMGELVVILAVLLLFVGPSALPGLAKSIGKGVRELRKATQDLKSAAMEDEDIGSTVRELQSALHGDPARPPAPAPTAGRTIGRPGAGAPVAAPAAVTPPAPTPASTAADAAAPASVAAAPPAEPVSAAEPVAPAQGSAPGTPRDG